MSIQQFTHTNECFKSWRCGCLNCYLVLLSTDSKTRQQLRQTHLHGPTSIPTEKCNFRLSLVVDDSPFLVLIQQSRGDGSEVSTGTNQQEHHSEQALEVEQGRLENINWSLNSLAPGGFEWNISLVICKPNSIIDGWCTSCEITFR